MHSMIGLEIGGLQQDRVECTSCIETVGLNALDALRPKLDLQVGQQAAAAPFGVTVAFCLHWLLVGHW